MVPLQVDVDAGAEVRPNSAWRRRGRPAREPAAPLAHVRHGDIGDEGIREGLEIHALLDEIGELRAVDQHVVEVAAVGGFLRDVHADVAVADLAPDEIEIRDVDGGAFADAR